MSSSLAYIRDAMSFFMARLVLFGAIVAGVGGLRKRKAGRGHLDEPVYLRAVGVLKRTEVAIPVRQVLGHIVKQLR